MARYEVIEELPKGRYEVVEDVAATMTPESIATPKPFQLGSELGRQVGLTARYGLEGAGNTLDFLASPIRAGLNLIPGINIKPGGGETLANAVGLPSPKSKTERIVGEATRLMAGSAVPLGLASKVGEVTTGVPQSIAKTIAFNPSQQIVSAGSAGGVGSTVRENQDNPLVRVSNSFIGKDGTEFAAALAAGIAAPYAMSKAAQAGTVAKDAAMRRFAPQRSMEAVDRAIENSGITLGDLAPNVRNSIRNDVQAAMRTDGDLSPDAIRRLADYRATGTTPTAARLSLDPAAVSRERNLAKIGINSNDKAAQQLGQVENANNRRLIENLNELGAGQADDAYAGGQRIIDSLSRRDDAAREAIRSRYDAARATGGRAANLDPSAFTQRANDMLDEALLGGKLPADVRGLLNKTAQGEMPLTVDVAEQLKTRIGDLQRASSDMAERKALGLVRQALDDTPLQTGQDIGQESINAFNRARRLNRAYMGMVENTPALQAVRDGVEPDKFVQQFVVGNGQKSNVSDLAALQRVVRNNPEALTAVKTQITSHLKKQALGGAADEVGNISQSRYNKALESIGDRKLAMFFTPDEVSQLKAVGRVASYEQFQPRGSAINNSNTAGALVSGILDRIAGSSILSKIPIANSVSDAARSITTARGAQEALNVPGALGLPSFMSQPQPRGLLLSPAVLAMPEDERKGLLAP